MYRKYDESVKNYRDFMTRLSFYYNENRSYMQDLQENTYELYAGDEYGVLSSFDSWYTSKELMEYSLGGVSVFNIGIDKSNKSEYKGHIRSIHKELLNIFK